MNRVAFARRLLAAALVPAAVLTAPSAFAYTVKEPAEGGAIAGVIRFADAYPEAEVIKVSQDPATCGLHQTLEGFVVNADTKGLKNVVAYIDGMTSGKPFPETSGLELNQEGCRYEPHVQVGFFEPKALTRVDDASGVALEIVNGDDVFHNVHSLDADGKTLFNIPSLPGKDATKLLPAAGLYHIKCDIHPWMSAYVMLVDHPYVAVSNDVGMFRIENVPPGSYKLILWHEELGRVERDVVVKAGEDTPVEIVIGG